MPESYKLLPPEEQVQGFMEWTFSDESGNVTDYPSFDVFVAHSSRSRSVGPAPDLVCLYKDLTEHYKNQYPDAGEMCIRDSNRVKEIEFRALRRSATLDVALLLPMDAGTPNPSYLEFYQGFLLGLDSVCLLYTS